MMHGDAWEQRRERKEYGVVVLYWVGAKWVGVVSSSGIRRSEVGEVAWGSIELRACRTRYVHLVRLGLTHTLASR